MPAGVLCEIGEEREDPHLKCLTKGMGQIEYDTLKAGLQK